MKKKKWLIIVLVTIVLIGLFSSRVCAVDELIRDMEGIGTVEGATGSHVRYVMNAVIKLIQIVGSGIAIIVVIILGIKYMLASPGEKADYKKTAVPILIGCVLLFAASNLAGIIADVGNGLN